MRNTCGVSDFKKDMLELCDDCPIKIKIQNALVEQLEVHYRNYCEVQSTENSNKYLDEEIDSALNAMNYILKQDKLQEMYDVKDISAKMNRIEIYIWNKERARLAKKYKPMIVTSKDSESTSIREFHFINNFNSLSPERVYQYFKEELVQKGFLDECDLQKYLLLAFQETKGASQITRFRFKRNDRMKIYSIFYKFYLTESLKPHGQKTKYVDLLGGYFEGFSTEQIMPNFSKGEY